MTRATSYVTPVGSGQFGLADEGSIFAVNNAQSGIATNDTRTAFSDTAPFCVLYNNDAAGGKSLFLDYLALVATAAGTAGASVQCAITLDSGNRYSSGGTELTTSIVNPNGNAGSASKAKVYFGDITASAKTSLQRMVVGRRYLKGAIPVAGDDFVIKFGAADAPTSHTISTTSKVVINVPKIVVPPAWSALVYIWLPSQSGHSDYAPEMSWVERFNSLGS